MALLRLTGRRGREKLGGGSFLSVKHVQQQPGWLDGEGRTRALRRGGGSLPCPVTQAEAAAATTRLPDSVPRRAAAAAFIREV